MIPWVKRILECVLPRKLLRFPGFRVLKNWQLASGFNRIPTATGEFNLVYTNRGLATHPPLRLFCPAEVAVFELC